MKTSHVLAGAAASAAAVLFFVLPIIASASPTTTWNVPGDNTNTCTTVDPSCATIQTAVTAAVSGDTIQISGTQTVTSAINVNVPLTIKGVSAAEIDTTGSDYVFTINSGATGSEIENLTFKKTDTVADDAMILLGANNVQIENNTFESPFNIGDGETIRGLDIENGISGFDIGGNTFTHLRQPVYINVATGAVHGNETDNTKGWVVVSNSNVTFSGNTWGVGANANTDDIVIIANSPVGPDNYSGDTQTISQANNNAFVLDKSGATDSQSEVYVDASTGNDGNDGSQLSPLKTIGAGVSRIAAGGTVHVDNGSYSGAINVTENGIQIVGQSEAGVVITQNAGTPFGQGITVTAANGVGLSNMTFTTPNHAPMSYAFHSYQATNLSLSNLTFNGNGSVQTSGKGIGGVDINSTNGVLISNVNVNGYTKNGLSFTAQNISTDPITQNVALSNITSSGNAWDGIAFYTESSGNNGQNISGVTFAGTNSIASNTQGGIFFEGDTDTNFGNDTTPLFTVTGPSSATVDLSTVAFSSDPAFDIVNYQTAPVNALNATFGGLTGNAMTGLQRNAEDGKILDQLDHSNLGLVTYYTFVNNPSQSNFVGSPAYVRSNNSGDIAAVAMVPAQATAARFTFTDGTNTYSDVAGVEHVQAGQFPVPSTGAHQYRVGVSADIGTYTVTGEYEVNGTWYPITGTATTYVVGNPTGSFVFPNGTTNIFRPSDNPARVTVNDANDSFRDVIFNIDGTNYQVNRAQCDLREAGNRVLCDVSTASNWSNLSDGPHTVSATIYNQASNHSAIAGVNFTVDSSLPVVTNFLITNPASTYSTEIDVSADATDAGSGIQNVDFYVTAPRAGDNVCDGNGTSLVDSKVTTPTSGSTYTAALDTSALTGTYCVNVVAENLASGHSASQKIQVQIDNTPTVTTDAANPFGDTSATLNGTNGSVSADNTSFWWGTTMEGPFTAAVDPSSQLGTWSHDSGLGATGVGTSFDESLTTLTPGTTYYFVAWSQVGGTWYPGSVQSFTTTGTAPTASVTTDAATGVDLTDGTLNGTNGAIAASNTSFWWGTSSVTSFTAAADPSSQLPVDWSHDSGLGATGVNGSFNEPLSGLTASTTYYFAAWSQVGGTWYPGSVLSFTTSGAAPIISNEGLTTTATTATITWTTDHNATSRVAYGTSPQSTGASNTCLSTPGNVSYNCYGYSNSTDVTDTPADTNGVISHSVTVTGLTPGVTYYFRPISEGSPEAEGGELSGTPTVTATPSVTTDAATNLSDSDATLNAENGGVAADQASFWVSTSTIDVSNPNQIPTGVYSTPVLSNIGTSSPFSDQLSLVTTNGITANGNENMAAITPSTTYNYVAWAYINGQWYQGGQQSVTTSNTPPVAPTAVADSATTNMNTEVTIDVLANDTGNPTGIDTGSLTQPANGSATIDGNEIDYTPSASFSGSNTFTYESFNAVGTSSPTTVTVTVTDTTTPVLTLMGSNPDYIPTGSNYNDPGITISDTPTDNIDYYISVDGGAPILSTSFTPADLDTSASGSHTLTYTATDGGGNTGSTTRSVIVLDPITLALTSTSATDTTISDNPIPVLVTFSEPVMSFDTGDITVTNGSASNVQLDASSTTATFDVLPSSDGAITVVIPASAIKNMAGSANANSAEIDFTYAAAAQNSTPPQSGGGGGGNGPIVGGYGGGGPVVGVTTSPVPGQPTGPQGQVLGASTYNFANNLKVGSKGEDVTQLQIILIADGYLSIPTPTGYFGSLTKAAVIKFQAANGISPTSGYVGPLTRAVLNEGVTPTTTDEKQSLQQQLQQLLDQIAALSGTTTTH